MERLLAHADQYLVGLITPKEFTANVVGTLANHWDSISDDAVEDEFATQLATMIRDWNEKHG